MNPYEVLGVDKNTSNDDIKKAYRELSKKHHPDVNGGDDTKFKKIGEAYKILTDPKVKREWEKENMFKSNTRQSWGYSPNMDDILKDFMNSGMPFGNGPNMRFHTRVRPKTNGKSITVKAYLTLEDAFHGKVIEIKVDRYERINNEKRRLQNKKIKVTIPKGAKNGQQLVLRNQGNQGINGGRDGDIVINIEIRPHKYFMRKEHDLYATVKVPFTQAILGDEVKFKNINGELLTIHIPPRTKEDDVIEIIDKGMPIGNSSARGRLKIVVAISIPEMDDVELIKELQNKIGNKNELKPESMV